MESVADREDISACIERLIKSMENKASDCEELQAQFVKLTSGSKALPKNADYRIIDSFIDILITIISDNHNLPIALDALNILFTHLKHDDKVFNRFYPSRGVIAQLRLDKYLPTSDIHAKRLVLDFLTFLMRYYENIRYSDISSDPLLIAVMKKAERERIWIDLENLATNQDRIIKVSEENQQTTSKAITELFMYVEDIRKKYEGFVIELKKEMAEIKMKTVKQGRPVNIEGRVLDIGEPIPDIPFIKRMENEINGKIGEVHRIADRAMAETIKIGSKCDEALNRISSISNIADATAKKTLDIVEMVNAETLLIKETRGIVLSRISRIENELAVLATNTVPEEAKQLNTKDITILRINSIRNQIDTDILPQINELHIKLKSIEIGGGSRKEIKEEAANVLILKLSEKGIEGIVEMVKSGMDTFSGELKAYKNVLDTVKETTIQLRGSKDSIKNDLQKCFESKSKQIYSTLEDYVKENTVVRKTIDEKIKSFTSELESNKRESIEMVKKELNVFNDVIARHERKFVNIESFSNNLLVKILGLEDQLKLSDERLTKFNGEYKDIETQSKLLADRIQAIEREIRKVINELNENCIKRNDQLKQQIGAKFSTALGYIQSSTDLHARDKIAEIKSDSTNYTSKLNCLKWIIHYHDYVSDKSIIAVIDAFRELIHPTRIQQRNLFASAKHASDIMIHLVKTIGNVKRNSKGESSTETNIYMSILEIALVNDQNIENGLNLGLLQELIQQINYFIQNYKYKDCSVEFKLVVRCLTYCFKSPCAIDLLMQLPNGIQTIVTLIEDIKDDEIIANSMKIMRVCLRMETMYDKIIQRAPRLIYTLMNIINTRSDNIILMEEATGALRNYTRKLHTLEKLEDLTLLEPLCRLAMEPIDSRVKENSIAILSNCAKVDKLSFYARQVGII